MGLRPAHCSGPVSCPLPVDDSGPASCPVDGSGPAPCPLPVDGSGPASCPLPVLVDHSGPAPCPLPVLVDGSGPASCPLPVDGSGPVSCPLPVDGSGPASCPLPVDGSGPVSCPLPVLVDGSGPASCPLPVDGSGPAPCPLPEDGSGHVSCPLPVDGSGSASCPLPVDGSGPAPCQLPVDGSGPASCPLPVDGCGPVSCPLPVLVDDSGPASCPLPVDDNVPASGYHEQAGTYEVISHLTVDVVSPAEVSPNAEIVAECSTTNGEQVTCPPSLALQAIESTLTPRKYARFVDSDARVKIIKDPVYMTWRYLREQVQGKVTPALTPIVDDHPLVLAGLIPKRLADMFPSPPEKTHTGRISRTKAIVLTSEEISKGIREREEERNAAFRQKEERKKAKRRKRELKLDQAKELATKQPQRSVDIDASQRDSDPVAEALIGVRFVGMRSVVAGADENCLPRTASYISNGTERLHVEMRVIIVHELIAHRALYLDDAFLSRGLATEETRNVALR